MHCIQKWRCYLEGANQFQVLTDHKSLEFFKTQNHLSRRQAEWMSVVQRYPMQITYKPGKEMLTADALSRLYKKHSSGNEGLDPDWPMLIMGNLQEGFPPGVTMITQEKVLKNKHLFKNVYGTLHQSYPTATRYHTFPPPKGLTQCSSTTGT